jgi:D-methionine transport system ATP-binding protein
VVITHEMKVIDSICDRVAVIDQSRIAEEGKVSEVFANPRSDIASSSSCGKDDAGPSNPSAAKSSELVFDGVTSKSPSSPRWCWRVRPR